MTSRDELTRTEERVVSRRVVEDRETVRWYTCPNCAEDHLQATDVVPVSLGGPITAAAEEQAEWRVVRNEDLVYSLLCDYCAESIFGEDVVADLVGTSAAGELEALTAKGAAGLIRAATNGQVEQYQRRRARYWSRTEGFAARLSSLAAWLWTGLIDYVLFPLTMTVTTALLALGSGFPLAYVVVFAMFAAGFSLLMMALYG